MWSHRANFHTPPCAFLWCGANSLFFPFFRAFFVALALVVVFWTWRLLPYCPSLSVGADKNCYVLPMCSVLHLRTTDMNTGV